MKTTNLTNLDEAKDQILGEIGTPRRDQYETRLSKYWKRKKFKEWCYSWNGGYWLGYIVGVFSTITALYLIMNVK